MDNYVSRKLNVSYINVLHVYYHFCLCILRDGVGSRFAG